MKEILIILSSKLVDQSLQQFFGSIPSAMIPFEGRTALDYIYESAVDLYDEIYLTTYENAEIVEKHIAKKKYNIKIAKLDKIQDIGYSVKYVIDKYSLEETANNLTVLFADVYLINKIFKELLNKDIALYSQLTESERWTTFDLEDYELTIYDKMEVATKDFHNVFIGAFNFTSPRLLKDVLYQADVFDEKLDSFYRAVSLYNEKRNILFSKTTQWHDLGHIDNYLNTKKIVQSRYFNTIIIDDKKGIITKRSIDVNKFENEISWYLNLPKDLIYLTPRIFNYSLDRANMFIEMEYYGYPTLHDIYIYSNYSTEFWKKVIDRLLKIIIDFRTYSLDLYTDDALKNIYLNKTITRLETFSRQGYSHYFSEPFIINHRKYKSLNEIIDLLPKIIKDKNLFEIEKLNIVHGDFFLANILYDPNTNIVRLIDARGDFGGNKIYGDSRYDLAKLAHSFEGKYDFIVEDLFDLEIKGNEIKYQVNYDNRHNIIEEIYYEKVSELCDVEQIRLIQALLFLSMLPLHKDKPQRQMIMLATGIELLASVAKGEIEC